MNNATLVGSLSAWWMPIRKSIPDQQFPLFVGTVIVIGGLALYFFREILRRFGHDRDWAQFIFFFAAIGVIGYFLVNVAYKVVSEVATVTQNINAREGDNAYDAATQSTATTPARRW